MRADAAALEIFKSAIERPAAGLKLATEQDFFTEYNDYILNIRVVDGVPQAIDHINYYGSAHSDSIVTAQ